jgi:2-polyprenyl-6-hydroxyphenyl methylase/3-demethylubiquinone-9 3-methyltransferase
VGIGPMIRHRLGSWEVPASEFYRNRFINLDDLAATVASLVVPKRILEIGCGEGAFGQRLCDVFPDAEYLGIDIVDTVGRLFIGDRGRATFRRMTSGELVAERPNPFDLVCLVDVVHHLPEDLRVPILADAAMLTSNDGAIAVKEWERGQGLAHVLAFAADRYVSGDATVRFADSDELRRYLAAGLPGFEITCQARIPPRRNNLLYLMRRTGG